MDMDKTAIGVTDAGEATQAIDIGAEYAIPDSQANVTQMACNVDCPVCRTANPPSETYCIDCGFLLASAPVGVMEASETPRQIGSTLVTTDGTREFPLNPGANTVGRENADVLLVHNTVSRSHATITIEDGHAFVEDSGSTNGTYVTGQKVAPGEKVDLTDGSELTFGSFTLRYEAPAAAVEQEANSDETPSPEVEDLCEAASVESNEQDQTPIPAGDDSGEAAAVARLISKDGSLTFDIRSGTNTIGRREGDNDIVVPDPYCSGRHADISFEDGALALVDIGSSNGTLVNGVKLEPNVSREVREGDEITLGRTVFRLEVD